MRHLIVNADGYGFTAGISRAIEDCIEFGTVCSLSANVNFPWANGLYPLVQKYPQLSVGCHINPIVGRPIMAPEKVPTLVNEHGEFFYQTFLRRFLTGRIRRTELRAEMMAQAQKTRDLAGAAFSHIDFHMGLHRVPGLYELFLEVAERSRARRIRTHRYLVGMENRFPRLRHLCHLFESPTRLPKFLINLGLRRKALRRNLAMPDRWVSITYLGVRPDTINVENYVTMLARLPNGYNEFVAHPGYVDDELKRWSDYLEPREEERRVLLDPAFREALLSSGVHLAGYRDIPVQN
jgi:predicted glycoside hydrolase/deacetylase ChbG (UPF0249 family)